MIVIFDLAKHALTITSFVAVMMLVIEYVNVLTQGAWQTHLAEHRWGQYLLAAFLGATPGCLGAFAVVGMYTHGALTRGAVVAGMIATMGDETFVMLALLPKQTFLVMGILFVLSIGVGALTDAVIRKRTPFAPAPCDALTLHTVDSCNCFPRGRILRQWRECSMARGVLALSLALFILGLVSGQFGPSSRIWIRLTLVAVSALALFIVSTVPDHFLEEHLWNHIARKHVPRIFLWTFAALALLFVVTEQLHLEGTLEQAKWLVLLVACLIGLVPESGPHMIFVTLYAQGVIPFSILLGSSIVQDGHGMLPLLAHSRRDFLDVKAINFLAGLLVGGVALSLGW